MSSKLDARTAAPARQLIHERLDKTLADVIAKFPPSARSIVFVSFDIPYKLCDTFDQVVSM
jgi:hypothetical protein